MDRINLRLDNERRALKAAFRGDMKFQHGRDKPSERAQGLEQLKQLPAIEKEVKIRENWSVTGRPAQVLLNEKQLNALQALNKAIIQKYYNLPSDQGRTKIVEDIRAKKDQIRGLGSGSETEILSLQKDISDLKLLRIVPVLVEEQEINEDQLNKLNDKINEIKDLRKATTDLGGTTEETGQTLDNKAILARLRTFDWQSNPKSNNLEKRKDLILRINKLEKKFKESVDKRQDRIDEIKNLFSRKEDELLINL